MSGYIHKSHNVTVLLYHLVFPAKYRRAVIDASVDQVLREVCLEIEARYQLKFLEIGTDKDHVHFLVVKILRMSPFLMLTVYRSSKLGACAKGSSSQLTPPIGFAWRRWWPIATARRSMSGGRGSCS